MMHNNSSIITSELHVDDNVSIKSIKSKTTAKRKSLFSNIEQESKLTKDKKIDNDAFIQDEINIYLNDDDDDDDSNSNRFILIDQSVKYRAVN